MVRYKSVTYTVCYSLFIVRFTFWNSHKIASEELEFTVCDTIAVRQKMVRRITLKYVLT